MADVICYYCNQKFNRAKEPSEIVIGRRYAHKKCYDKVAQLQEYLSNVMGEYYSAAKIRNQLNKITKEEYELDDVCNTMYWWYDIKKGDPSKSNGGIGIFSYIYTDYLQYKKNQEKISMINTNKSLKEYVDEEPEQVFIHRTPIKRPKRVKLFDLK